MQAKKEKIELDFEFDSNYMFNECFLDKQNRIVFTEHLAGKELDYIYVYDLNEDKWVMYKEEYKNRELNGKTKIIINKDGKDIIVF